MSLVETFISCMSHLFYLALFCCPLSQTSLKSNRKECCKHTVNFSLLISCRCEACKGKNYQTFSTTVRKCELLVLVLILSQKTAVITEQSMPGHKVASQQCTDQWSESSGDPQQMSPTHDPLNLNYLLKHSHILSLLKPLYNLGEIFLVTLQRLLCTFIITW